ncbi:hypothetical protein PsYK624_172490 [Phanerochaete sordida]|uniref:Uncharacterized protein n=1 Tax=Phanerochaete sordida TaxID=48140 RepID=A0A9P3LPD6_9APHY|nr:hypothetical protein PsYK624_172490 [Phanerochaete sordida]
MDRHASASLAAMEHFVVEIREDLFAAYNPAVRASMPRLAAQGRLDVQERKLDEKERGEVARQKAEAEEAEKARKDTENAETAAATDSASVAEQPAEAPDDVYAGTLGTDGGEARPTKDVADDAREELEA